ncbi:MAG: MotA/TolQ/ExbB proton channel family protein [Synechococcaceae cyanobacterium MAG-AL2]|uniref:MotA/TolQ/ExbB proton channel family protein n=1 Tax=Candidatus Regnicoccus frigidus TaxID=3074015 RepID=UPI002818C1A5|nr:MotA/TolQ/ExbB proton channel family protein [Candidatus Regnicoccus frigidus]MCT4364332.1 MotA/TolQ/ExbB proton channel family protein [Candidatus Regnicoccus frigidus MAG-AL1]MCT4367481.1 MotA/TolQ/ExbB proton channel family protein [Candidatus Regnicoccus frigidus MAG-AL2]
MAVSTIPATAERGETYPGLLELPARRWIESSSLLSIVIGVTLTLVVVMLLFPYRGSVLGSFLLDRGLTQPLCLAIAFTVVDYCGRRLLASRRERRHVGRDWMPRGLVDLRPLDSDVQTMLVLLSQRRTVISNRLCRLLRCFQDSRSRQVTRELHQDDIALTQSDIEDSYLVTRTMIWVLPMLGFLGTVLGISTSIGGFTGLLANIDDLETVKASLTAVTGGLSTAFDTTLLGIVTAVLCMVLMSIAERGEHQLAGDIEASINDGFFPRLSGDATNPPA